MMTRRSIFVAAVMLSLPPSATASETLLVHLPSAPVESSTQLATAVEGLADYVNSAVPGLELNVEMFRRWEDAQSFFAENRNTITAVLSDASFLLDVAPDDGFVPVWRFVRTGKQTYHRLLVVKAGRDIDGVEGLRTFALSVVKTTGSETHAFLAQSVFAGELAPQDWFGSLSSVSDDFTAVAHVLHEQIDAALVAEHNPLLRSQLGQELELVYTSPPLSLPVLVLREGGFDSDQRVALDRALEEIGRHPDGQQVLATLGLDGLAPVIAGSGPFDRDALFTLASARRKTMAVALPSPAAVSHVAPPIEPKDVTFGLAIELPELSSARTRTPEND